MYTQCLCSSPLIHSMPSCSNLASLLLLPPDFSQATNSISSILTRCRLFLVLILLDYVAILNTVNNSLLLESLLFWNILGFLLSTGQFLLVSYPRHSSSTRLLHLCSSEFNFRLCSTILHLSP